MLENQHLSGSFSRGLALRSRQAKRERGETQRSRSEGETRVTREWAACFSVRRIGSSKRFNERHFSFSFGVARGCFQVFAESWIQATAAEKETNFPVEGQPHGRHDLLRFQCSPRQPRGFLKPCFQQYIAPTYLCICIYAQVSAGSYTLVYM